MKKLKLWLKKQIEDMSDQADPNMHHAGKKTAYENVLAEIKKMENSIPKNIGDFLDKSMKEFKMYERSFERPKNYFKLDEREQWRIDAKLGILDWKGDDLTKSELKRFHEYYDEN